MHACVHLLGKLLIGRRVLLADGRTRVCVGYEREQVGGGQAAKVRRSRSARHAAHRAAREVHRLADDVVHEERLYELDAPRALGRR